ncbi:hypothetical protein FB451DRAFT_1358872 [Mycena latifolia]|nr:hypothetical protein FB451DRAFT_1358872 [Mycena latifolia]
MLNRAAGFFRLHILKPVLGIIEGSRRDDTTVRTRGDNTNNPGTTQTGQEQNHDGDARTRGEKKQDADESTLAGLPRMEEVFLLEDAGQADRAPAKRTSRKDIQMRLTTQCTGHTRSAWRRCCALFAPQFIARAEGSRVTRRWTKSRSARALYIVITESQNSGMDTQ